MLKSDYSRGDLVAALERLPLAAGDVVFSHSNLGFFGRTDAAQDANSLCAMFLEEILARIAPGGTLVVPTFTYSFPRGQAFDPADTPSSMGMFAEYVRKHRDARRSLDPCYSVAAIGARASELTKDVGPNSFDDTSFFGRFMRIGGKVLNLNFDAGSTFVHFVERELNVPYRFDKTFKGVVRDRNADRTVESTIWVRYLSDESLEVEFTAFDKLARDGSLFHIVRLGRGEIGTISAADTKALISQTLPTRPLFLTKAERQRITVPLIDREQLD